MNVIARIAGSAALGLALFAVPADAVERPAPDAVKSCPGHGPGFYEIPGTTTCIRIGGRVRSEFVATTGKPAYGSATGFRNSGMISMDTRTDTAYGPVRTYVRVRAGSNTGAGNAFSRP